jgi:hypothetical protein
MMTRMGVDTVEKTKPDISHSGEHNNTIKNPSLLIPGQPFSTIGEISPAVVLTKEVGGRSLVEKSITLLFALEPSTRIAAADALGTLGDQSAIEPLFRACMDENAIVKQAAREALARISMRGR